LLLLLLYENDIYSFICESSFESFKWKSVRARWPPTRKPTCKPDL